MSWISEWIGDKKKAAAPAPGTTPVMKDVFKSTADAALAKTVNIARTSTVGKVAEAEATKQAIMDVVSSPLFIVGVVLVFFVFIKGK